MCITGCKKAEYVLAKTITFDKTEITLQVGEMEDIIIMVTPDDAVILSLTWESSNTAVAMVDSYGKVMAVGEGTAIITCQSSNKVTALCTVNVIKKEESDSKIFSESLYGVWIWSESSGGIAGMRLTPITEGYSSVIEFHQSGIYKEYKNEQLEMTSKFTLTTGNTIYTSEIANLIEFEAYPIMQSIEFGKSDTLFLRDECFDCFVHTYVRK